MDKSREKALRKKLDNMLIKLVAPPGMGVTEFKIECNLNAIDATVENGVFLHWVMISSGDDDIVANKVDRAIINAINKKYLLDTSNKDQCARFCDAVRDLVLIDKHYAADLIEAVLNNYKESDGHGPDVFDFCKRLNKAFGFTSVEYFR